MGRMPALLAGSCLSIAIAQFSLVSIHFYLRDIILLCCVIFQQSKLANPQS